MSTPPISFYYAEDEIPQGPFAAAHILSLKSLGKIGDETYVIQSGGTEWKSFSELEPFLHSLLFAPSKPQESQKQSSPTDSAIQVAEQKDSRECLPSNATERVNTDTTFTEAFLTLAKELDSPEKRFSRLAPFLGSFSELTEAQARRIVAGAVREGFQGSLELSNLKEISKDFAELLASHPTREEVGEILYLNGLEELPFDIAEALAKHKGYLSLSGVTSLSSKAAAILKKHAGRLDLEGLTELPEPVAKELAEHQHHLTLDGVKSISLPVLAILGKHAESIDLHGLKRPTQDILEALNKYPQIKFGAFEDDNEDIGSDEDDRDSDTGSQEENSDDENPSDSNSEDGTDDTGTIDEGNIDEASFDPHQDETSHRSSDLKRPSSDIAENDSQEVKAFKIMDLIWGDDEEGVVQGLNLISGLDRVTLKRIFRFFPKRLDLSKLRQLPQSRGLELYSGDLSLGGIKSLTPEMATILAGKIGGLNLNGLTCLQVDLAKALSAHRGSIYLNGVKTITLEAAQEMSKHDGKVFFDSLRNLPDEIQKVFRKMDGYAGPRLRPPLQDFEFLSKLLDVPQSALARLAGVSQWGGRTPLYRVFFIPKRNGSSRIIHSPCDSLRWIQGLIKACILDPAPVHSECVSAFRAGRSILHHAMQHAGKAVVIKMDLQDFFPSVTFPKVEQVFRKLGFAGAVARQLTLLTTTNLREGREMPEEIPPETQGLSRQETWRALPQGSPTSPQLANMAAARLDLRLIGLCKSFGFHYSRYADDLTFSSPESKAKASTMIRAVQQIVETSGFWVNAEKTRIMRATSTQKVTGLIVGSGQPRVPRKVMRKVRAMVHQSKTKNSFQEHNRLRGYLSFIKMINEDQFSKFKALPPGK